ncbi:hypothetical protein, partial [Pseudomonas juntendi]|uniref:hypothetical protein n=1 Tax=Pseudomonas juntendi TaxID=2666183 RepID=UPI001C70B01A
SWVSGLGHRQNAPTSLQPLWDLPSALCRRRLLAWITKALSEFQGNISTAFPLAVLLSASTENKKTMA